MKWIISLVPIITCSLLFAAGRKNEFISADGSGIDTATGQPTLAAVVNGSRALVQTNYTLSQLDLVVQRNENTQFSLGRSKEGRNIPAFYIPGSSRQRALVIAGVHGSELSSVEVAFRLVSRLLSGDPSYYSVIIVPSLFPDNACRAAGNPVSIGSTANIGRYTYPDAPDPNRQMPSPGTAFDSSSALDHVGRRIEEENRLLLQLIQLFRPQRIANIHAIRDQHYGGVYADPRTDSRGIALGYSSDSSLAVDIARYIDSRGGNVAGNKLKGVPTALYYKDPPPAPAGQWQKRNMTGSILAAHRGSGISLGTWASTAVRSERYPSMNREAMRILTIEYPGCKRPGDYKKESQQLLHFTQVELYASAIEKYFLGNYYVEDELQAYAHQ